MTTPEHRHDFRPADLRYNEGDRIEGGRRCPCGMEVVGDGPFALNAQLVRAARSMNVAVARAAEQLARAINRGWRP